jgi:hypothetical protein
VGDEGPGNGIATLGQWTFEIIKRAGCRLVEQQELRPLGERDRDFDEPLPALGQFPHQLAGVGDAARLQARTECPHMRAIEAPVANGLGFRQLTR